MFKTNRLAALKFLILLGVFLVLVISMSIFTAKEIKQEDIVTIDYNNITYPYSEDLKYFYTVFASKHEIKDFKVQSFVGDGGFNNPIKVKFDKYYSYTKKTSKYKGMFLYNIILTIDSDKPIDLKEINARVNWKSEITLPINVRLEEVNKGYDASFMAQYEISDYIRDKQKLNYRVVAYDDIKIKKIEFFSSLYEAKKISLDAKEFINGEAKEIERGKSFHISIEYKDAPIDVENVLDRVYIKITFDSNGEEKEFYSTFFSVGRQIKMLYEKIDKIVE